MNKIASKCLLVSLVLLVIGCEDFFDTFGDDDDGPGGISGSETCEAAGDDPLAEAECEVFDLVNERRAAGASCGSAGSFEPTHALTLHPALTEAARLHSLWMGENNYFAHESPGGPNGDTVEDRIENAGYTDWAYMGENIAAGAASAEEVMHGWMDSPGHCANIMSPNFTQIGIGYAQVSGSDFYHYWTQDFGTPQ